MNGTFPSERVFRAENFIRRFHRKKIVISILLFIMVAPASGIFIIRYYDRSSIHPLGQNKMWNLVFDDEFDGESLDTAKWVPCFHWGTDAGCGSTTTPQNWYLQSNVAVSNGTLKLKAQHQRVIKNGTVYPYTSAMITTGPWDATRTGAKFSFTYGYMEIRAKVPRGQGLWPAFWALPADSSELPEIDVSEILTGSGFTTHMNSMTYHISGYSSGASWTSSVDLADNFHVYAVSWQPDGIHWYVDGVERRAAFTSRKNITAKQMYLLLQLEVGGSLSGSPDGSTPFPSVYEVDYVRVWQR